MENPEQNSADAAPLIELRNVVLSRLQTRGEGLEEINWRVLPGDFWVVAGLFASGKSDFLSTAAGLQRPARGSVRIFGEETFAVDETVLVEQRRRIGLVFSGGGRLFNRLTVAENVALPVRYHRNWDENEAEPAVREIMELTELIPFAQQIPSALSPNWQQRTALARALILRPEILLLDNPLFGMDFRHQQWWFDFLQKLSEGSVFAGDKKISIVVTADNLERWKTSAKQFVVLKNNRWHEVGGREKLESSDNELIGEFLA